MYTIKQPQMQDQLKHKRFTERNESLSSALCYWYALEQRNMEPTGNVNDSIHKWLCNFYT
jgi:hypothetical protein